MPHGVVQELLRLDVMYSIPYLWYSMSLRISLLYRLLMLINKSLAQSVSGQVNTNVAGISLYGSRDILLYCKSGKISITG